MDANAVDRLVRSRQRLGGDEAAEKPASLPVDGVAAVQIAIQELEVDAFDNGIDIGLVKVHPVSVGPAHVDG